MNTKKIFSTLLATGVRLTILASMLVTALASNVSGVVAAPMAAINNVSVSSPTGTLTTGTAGDITYTVTVNNSNQNPVTNSNVALGLTWSNGNPAPAGVTFSFSPATLSWTASGQKTSTLTMHSDGTTPATNRNFRVTAAGQQSSNTAFVVSLPAPTITFGPAPTPTPGSNFTVSVTSNSTGAKTYSRVSGPCARVGNSSSSTFSTSAAGVCRVQVNIAATTSYAAGSATQDVTIALPTPTITFGAAPAATFPGGNFTVNATTNSNGALTYSWVGGPCAFVSGATFSPSGTGTCVVQASTAATSTYAAGSAQQSITITAGSSSAFDLYAVTGTTTLPGSITVPVWGYTLGSAGVITKPGGPVLIVNQNALVTITLHNNMSETTALLFQGQKMIPDLTGASVGGTHVYTFTASQPGTFLYEAGLIPGSQHQVAMGLYGTLIVRPADGASQAYANSPTSNTAFDAEQVLMLSELDVDLNNNPAGFDMRNYSPEFYLINGKAYPSTDPISVAAGNKVLLRYVNAGLQAHAMTTLGLTQSIIGQDGSAYKYSRSVVSETIATGQTLDTIVTVGVNGSNYPIYDASLFLRNNTGAGLGGMLTTLTVGAVTPPPPPSDTTGPVASALVATPNPTTGSDVTVTASISDVDKGNSNVDAAELYVDSTSGSPIAMTGTFGTPTVSVTGTIPASLLGILAAGDHTVYVRGHDVAGNWGNFATIILTLTSPAPGLNFSTSGTTSAGPSGVGADAADIYFWNGSAFSLAFDAPAGTNVDGYDQVGSIYYMSFAGDVTSPLVAQNEDVVSYDGATWSVFFDGTAYGLAASNIDAVSVVGGTLYFSTSDATLPAGVTGVGDDADIYSWNGSIITRVFDATAQGWSSNNVDGFVYVDADTFYLSYSPTSTTVAGLGTVQDEDVLKYDAGVWSVYFDGTAHGLTDTALDVDAFDIP